MHDEALPPEAGDPTVPVIDLSSAPGSREAWGRSRWKVFLWSATELLLITNPWQISSSLRVRTLRAFGADIGEGVILRPRTRIKFPWNLKIGDRSWIGEGVWIHNQDQVVIGHDAVISQETFITNGSHAHRRDMALITRPVTIREGTWVATRCIVLGGTHLGTSCLVRPASVVSGTFPANRILGGNPAVVEGRRFDRAVNGSLEKS